MKPIPARRLAAALIVIVGVLLVIGIVVFGLDHDAANSKDFLQYWTAERLLASGGNPYDFAATLALERSVGFKYYPPLITLSPPIALFFGLPLAWVNANIGLTLWMLLSIACLLASVALVWLLQGRPESRYHLVGVFFPPALRCLIAGQLGIFFLLEIVLFFYLQKSRPFWAGAALVFCALKPHLFLPCFLVMLLWTVVRRQFHMVAGFISALALNCGLTLLVDRQIWTEYQQMLHMSGIMNDFLPTLWVWIRFLADRNARWIEFIPEAAACVWASWYFWSRRARWNWLDHGLLVLVVSVACSPYSWYTDQSLLLPAIVIGLTGSDRSIRSLALFALIAGAGLVAMLIDIKLTSAFFVWTAPAWLLWYAYARHVRGRAEHARA